MNVLFAGVGAGFALGQVSSRKPPPVLCLTTEMYTCLLFAGYATLAVL